MSQPHWIPEWNHGQGCFIFADESALYVLDCDQNIIWQLFARIAFSGFTVDGNTIYVLDGYVLFRYDLDILHAAYEALLRTPLKGYEGVPQRAYNLITEQRYAAAPSEGKLSEIFNLVAQEDKVNLEKLAVARRLRSWVQLIQDAQKERRKTDARLAAPDGGGSRRDLLVKRNTQLAKTIEDTRWLLGVDALDADRSCEALFASTAARIRTIETDAAHLRFSPPTLRTSRAPDGRAVYVMDGTGLVMGLTPTLSSVQGTQNDAPIALGMLMETNADRTTSITYLTAVGLMLLTAGASGITRVGPTPTLITSAEWVESLALKTSQSRWAKASLAAGDLVFMIQNVSTPTSKDLLFVSSDDSNDTSALHYLTSLSAFPPADGSNDFRLVAPRLKGGIIAQQTQMSYPVIAPVRFHPEGGIVFVYAVTYSAFSPTKLLEWIDDSNGTSKWTEFVGADIAAKTKTREKVKSGQIGRPQQTCRSIVWHKVKLQDEVSTEEWLAAWRGTAELWSPVDRESANVAQMQDTANRNRDNIIRSDRSKTGPYNELCQRFRRGESGRSLVNDCSLLANRWGVPYDRLWSAGLHERDLGQAEARRTAAEQALTAAVDRARAAYSTSPLWNAWKQAGSQLLNKE